MWLTELVGGPVALGLSRQDVRRSEAHNLLSGVWQRCHDRGEEEGVREKREVREVVYVVWCV